jgi:hypothetical protein
MQLLSLIWYNVTLLKLNCLNKLHLSLVLVNHAVTSNRVVNTTVLETEFGKTQRSWMGKN